MNIKNENQKATSFVRIFECRILNSTMEETLEIIRDRIYSGEFTQHCVINAAKVVSMNRNDDLRLAVNGCEIINADGQSIIWASHMLKKPIKERVAGIDLMLKLMDLAQKEKFRVYLFGAEETVLKKAEIEFKRLYPRIIICGRQNGYYKPEQELEIAKKIGKSYADIVFVAMGSPRKEIFINSYKRQLNTKFVMGVGGSFDVVAGKVHRAPLWFQKFGMEWFYRFLQEPKRLWKRYLFTNATFIWILIREMFKKDI